MTKREKEQHFLMTNALMNSGITYADCETLRRISLTLHSWYEKECGLENGHIERNEETGKPYWVNSSNYKRHTIPDQEKGAKKRLKVIMAKYPHLTPYLQTDPRGATLYILRPQDLLPNVPIDSCYSRGICVY